METKFLINDVVEWCGVRGKITIIRDSHLFPLECIFNDAHLAHFTSDGKAYVWHKEPSLNLIERPKKKVKMYRVLFQRGADFGVSHGVYTSEDTFNRHNNNELGYKFIQLIKESEIEVEE
jgi:hypothetical protein